MCYPPVDTVEKADNNSQLTGYAYDQYEFKLQQHYEYQNHMCAKCYILAANKRESKSEITNDIWQRIREGYGINNFALHENAEKRLRWFNSHPNYIDRVIKRASTYLYYIVNELERRNMPLEIALLPIVESGFKPFAYSHGQAAGLWQFIPETGKVYGLKQNWWYDGRRDVIESTRAGLDYLQKLHNNFNDWQLALAAYNGGEGTVNRAIKSNKKKGKPIDFWSLELPKQTFNYVAEFMALVRFIAQPKNNIIPFDNSEKFTIVEFDSQIDLLIVSRLAQITMHTMYQYNPGLKRWATTPNGPHSLVLPLENADIFNNALKKLPLKEYMLWTRHINKSGESLSIIAQHYGTTVEIIMNCNELSSDITYSGHDLLIPVSDNNCNY